MQRLAEALGCDPGYLVVTKGRLLEREAYEHFVIVAKTRRLKKTGRWTLAIQIERHTGPEILVKAYNAADTFDAKEAAVEGCIVFGRRIIDGQVPGLSPP